MMFKIVAMAEVNKPDVQNPTQKFGRRGGRGPRTSSTTRRTGRTNRRGK